MALIRNSVFVIYVIFSIHESNFALSAIIHEKNNEDYIVSSCKESQNEIQEIGCIANSLIPLESSFWIEFKDDGHPKNAKNCLLTCQEVYPNTR